MIKKLLKIKKIIEYIPVLWADEDYDYHYLLHLIKYKINRMKDCIDNNDIIVQESINVIKEGIDKTTKSIDNYYISDDLFEKEYGDIYKELNLERRFIKLDNGNSEYVAFYKGTDEKIKPRHEAKIRKHILKQLDFEQDLWNDIRDCLKENAQRWWD